MTSISTTAALGNAATWTVERAGKFSVKYFCVGFRSCRRSSARSVIEDGGLHDMGEGQALIFQDGLDVLEDAVGLHLDVAGDKIAIGGIDGDLAGAEPGRSPTRTAWL